MTDAVISHVMNVDGNWGTSRLRKHVATLSSAVVHIHFVAHTNPDNSGSDGQAPTNHWSMFLEIGKTSSVRVEVAPGDVGRPAMVIVESKNYACTNKQTRVETAVPATGTTVASIFSVLIANKRDQYIFAPVGEGCRFWLYTLASDLAKAGIISSSDAERIRGSLGMYWPVPSGSNPEVRAMSKGRFF